MASVETAIVQALASELRSHGMGERGELLTSFIMTGDSYDEAEEKLRGYVEFLDSWEIQDITEKDLVEIVTYLDQWLDQHAA